jgi:DNA polymerase III epsilon subunit-like protein
VLDAIDVLTAHPQGLTGLSIRRELAALGRHPAEFLQRELQRVIESCGVFRANSSGRFLPVHPRLLQLPLAQVPIVVMDLEATGGRPPLHRFVEAAVIRYDPDGTQSSYASLANPRRPLPWYVTKITGLTAREIREAPPVEQVIDEILPLLEGALLIFHGSANDLELLNYEIHRRTHTLLENPVVCTIALTHEFEPELQTMGLDRVATHLGIPVDSLHRAWDDACLTLAVYDRFLERFPRAGITRLVDLAFFQGKLPMPPFLATNLSVDLINSLPDGPAAFALFDEHRELLLASSSSQLHREMASLFFPDRVLDPDRKALSRAARYLEYRELLHLSRAQEAIDDLLAGADSGMRRRRRPRAG